MKKSNIYGYSTSGPVDYVKIYAHSPTALNAIKRICEEGFTFNDRIGHRSYATFESNMAIVLRFMIDTKMTGMNWIELPPNSYTIRPFTDQQSSCQYEVDVQ